MIGEETISTKYLEIHNNSYLMWKILNFDFNDEAIESVINSKFLGDYEALPLYQKAWYSIYHFFAEVLYYFVIEYPEAQEFTFQFIVSESAVSNIGDSERSSQ